MNKYVVWFNTTGGDYDKEWCYANSEEEAVEQIQHEHWNWESLIDVVKQ